MELYRNGELSHGYTTKPVSRTIDYFRNAIEHSYRPEAVFLNSLLMVRTYPDRSVIIRNFTLIEASGSGVRIKRIRDKGELPGEIETVFGIPREISAEAIADLVNFGNPWS